MAQDGNKPFIKMDKFSRGLGFIGGLWGALEGLTGRL